MATPTGLASRVAESSFFRGPPPASLRVLLGLMHRTPQATPEEMKGIIMETTEAVSETRSVAVTRVAHAQLEAVWRALMTPAGAQTLLGAGGQLGNKGESWKADDGTYGITRSFHPKEQIRFSWHASEGAPATLVDLRMRAVDGGTELTIVHGNLPEDADLEALRARPLLDLGMRLGEGTGAICAYPIVDSAVRMINEMDSFEGGRITKYFS